MRNQLKKNNLRKAIQSSIFVIMIFITLFMITGTIHTAHQFCPYSAVCFGAMFPKGIITYTTTIILSILVLMLTIFLGRKFCSYLCFLGTIQEKFYTIVKRRKPIKVHPKLHKILSLLKYLILISTLLLVIMRVQYEYFKACPVLSLSFLKEITFLGIIVLSIIFILGFFIERFWCRYLCPYAALMNIFQFIGLKLGFKRQKIIRNIPDSMNCRNCTNYCPMGIDVGCENVIADSSCIHCMKCIRYCLSSDRSKEHCIC